MGTDCRAIRKDHAQCRIHASDLFRQVPPDSGLQPANAQLHAYPPRTKIRWQGTSFCTILMMPENRGDRRPKVPRWRLAPFRTDFLDQRLSARPSLTRQDRLHHAHHTIAWLLVPLLRPGRGGEPEPPCRRSSHSPCRHRQKPLLENTSFHPVAVAEINRVSMIKTRRQVPQRTTSTGYPQHSFDEQAVILPAASSI